MAFRLGLGIRKAFRAPYPSWSFAKFWPFSTRVSMAPLDGQESFHAPSYHTAEEAANQSAVKACVSLLSNYIAALPLLVYRNQSNQRWQVAGHPIANLVEQRPNAVQDGYRWMVQTISDVCYHGNSVSVIQRDLSGQPVDLIPQPPGSVNVRTDGSRLWFEVSAGEERTAYEPSEVLHFYMQSTDGIRGRSLISAARRSIDLAIEQEMAGLHFFRQNASPTGVLTIPGRLSNEQTKRLRESWESLHSGPRRRVAILEEGTSFSPIGTNFQDSEWVKSRQMTGEDIARYFGVPPPMIGYEQPTGSTPESAMQSFLVTCVGPWLRMIESELTRKLLPPGDEFLHDTTRGQVRADTPARYAAYTDALQSG